MNVLASDIRYEALKSILFSIEDNAGFVAVIGPTVLLCAQENPKFQGHVEPRQRRVAVNFGARDIVYAITALSDYPADLIKPVIGRVVRLQ
jgi:hypothetical protein